MQPPVNKDGSISRRWKHGYSHEPLYTVWKTMLARCYNPKHNRFPLYGGRGISVCSEWHEYPAFRRWALDSGYGVLLQIDRIDTNGDYEPSNCRWALPKNQQRNRRNNRLVTYKNQTLSLAEWADQKECTVSYKVLWERLANGWTFEQALTKPQRRQKGYRLIQAFGEEKSLSEWCEDPRCGGAQLRTVWKRLNDGWAPEKAIVTPTRPALQAREG